MEITDVSTETLRVPLDEQADSRVTISERDWILVEIETDEGITGTGWMGTWRAARTFENYLTDELAGILVGRNPFATETIRRDLRDQTLYYPGELGMSAHPRGAIDVALWDLKGKATGLPLYVLLGGETPEVPIYASSLDAGLGPDALKERYERLRSAGYTMFKTKVGNRVPSAEAERIGRIRETVGPGATILADANQAWDVPEAIRVTDAIAEHDVAWVEEPVSEYNIDGHRRVARCIDPAVATGEMFYRPERFRYFLEVGGAEVAQPDLIRVGGVTGQIEVARLANSFDVPIAPHLYHAVSAHVVSAVSNGWAVERIPEIDVSTILKNPPTIEAGMVTVPDEPGHGYRIDPDARDAYRVSLD